MSMNLKQSTQECLPHSKNCLHTKDILTEFLEWLDTDYMKPVLEDVKNWPAEEIVRGHVGSYG